MENTILVTRSSMAPLEEYIEEIKPLWNTHWLTNMGVKHKEFQKRLKDYLGVENLDLLVNGHMALELTIQSLNLQGEVITTPFTFASTTHAIVRNGLEPVFCDIETDTYTLDAAKIEWLITDRTCAILPVHVFGNVCNVAEIERIARKHELKVIYDACHAFGEGVDLCVFGKDTAGSFAVEREGGEDGYVGVGNFGDASVFSFHATKVFNTIEGGCSCFRDPEVGARLYDLKNFGIHGTEEVSAVGANAKMNEFCAAMGICNLRHLEDEIKRRKAVDKRYRERLCVDGIKLNTEQAGVKRNYAYFPVLFDEKVFGASRAEVFHKLENNGIMARKYFHPLTNTFSAFHGKYDVGRTPAALHVGNRILCLPIYADLGLEDVDRICEIILECSGNSSVAQHH